MTDNDKIGDAKLMTCVVVIVLSLCCTQVVKSDPPVASQLAGVVLGVVATGAMWSFLLREGR